MTTGRSKSIDVLKAVAALLIINSHLEALHLRPWMAADGLLGNTIFFFTTGFTLASSLRRNPSQTLTKFLWNRFSRLYPAVWLVMILLPPLPFSWTSWDAWRIVMVYPTQFTFVRTIIPLYPVFYFLIRSNPGSLKLGIIALVSMAAGCVMAWWRVVAMVQPGVAWSELGSGAWFPHFGGAMLLGAYVALRPNGKNAEHAPLRTVIHCLLGCCVYLTLRIMALSSLSDGLGHLVQSLAVLSMPVTAFVILTVMQLFESPASLRLQSVSALAAIITFLSAHTWETYLLHVGIARLPFVSSAPYPLALIFVFALTLVLAPLLRRISTLPFKKARR